MTHLLTVRELAELMGWSDHTVYNRRYLGLPMPRSIKLANGAVRFRSADVEAWLDEHTEDSDEPKPAA